MTIATTLGIKESTINMSVRRLGGAFGGKISNASVPATACAVAAFKLGKPVRIVLDLKSNLEAVGKRLAGVNIKIFCDSGANYNESTADIAVGFAKTVYASPVWRLSPMAVLTDTPSNTYCRAPGSTQGHAIMETVMEHLAAASKTDPLTLREANMVDDPTLKEVLARLKDSSQFELRKRHVEDFNKRNLWRKRGISLVPLQYPHNQFGTRYTVNISVYHDDGSVAVAHGGIEMGQGMNTKVAQVVARELGVPMDIIRIKPRDNVSNPNATGTFGSMGSEGNVAAA